MATASKLMYKSVCLVVLSLQMTIDKFRKKSKRIITKNKTLISATKKETKKSTNIINCKIKSRERNFNIVGLVFQSHMTSCWNSTFIKFSSFPNPIHVHTMWCILYQNFHKHLHCCTFMFHEVGIFNQYISSSRAFVSKIVMRHIGKATRGIVNAHSLKKKNTKNSLWDPRDD